MTSRTFFPPSPFDTFSYCFVPSFSHFFSDGSRAKRIVDRSFLFLPIDRNARDTFLFLVLSFFSFLFFFFIFSFRFPKKPFLRGTIVSSTLFLNVYACNKQHLVPIFSLRRDAQNNDLFALFLTSFLSVSFFLLLLPLLLLLLHLQYYIQLFGTGELSLKFELMPMKGPI